ncbi:hypothetical protein [Chryseolinea lacunae]|uniref:Uncharacterized protein n=1 Tax=Chryseolinea lacunae TaxID=2801331 RepID=A0ABS1KS22_9BACT|nr:hypothetical protein [Chryseolinea lacunae]MBL0742052.1 hypothetical protein [Chryseolinea lacunae]
MKSIHQKHAILQSLESLDPGQTEKVLAYIKDLLYAPLDEASRQQLKREGLREIRQALGKGRKLTAAF